MRVTKKKNLLLSGTILSAFTLLAPTLALAQAPAASATDVEEIVVTGSLIKRDPVTAPTPLIQIDKEAIQQSGEINIVDYLADIPALQNSQVYEDTTGGFVGIGGLALLNLRNLGSGRTLVLVDGRRHVAGSPGGAAVDVDTIPSGLVERVEIITGGASALYGADAVSGVVNFILKDDFEGLELNADVGQLAEGTSALNKKFSVLYGKTLMDGRLNLYGYAERQTSDVVFDKDLDIDWVRNEERLVTLDVDPSSAVFDGVNDVNARAGLRSLNRPLGGVLVLANGTQASATSDPDIPFGSCTVANANTTAFQANCFATNPGSTFQFDPAGNFFAADFGGGQTVGAVNRTITFGGSGDRLVAVETNRLPEQEANRFQVGANFEILPSLRAFGELKYVEETNIDIFQPHFANINIRAFGPTEYPTDVGGLITFSIGLDNAYLPAALRTAITNNQRTVYGAPTATSPGAVTGTVNDRRALFRLFSYDLGYRPAIAERETLRFVGGFRGDFDSLAFVKDVAWEVGYTYGKMEAVNTEPETIDVERYAYSADAVFDTTGRLGTAGAIVCRVQLLVANGIPVRNPNTGVAYTANDPTIRDCKPSRIFGSGGFEQSRSYILTSVITDEENEQKDVRAFASGNLWDFWGAGPIGVAVGGEYRKETTSADLTDFGDRVLFGNSGGDLEKVGFDVKEFFAEIRLPLLKDMPFAQTLELNGAFRRSDYSSIGVTETYSTALFWRPFADIAVRGTYGTSVRAPTLGELYSPPFDTFPSLNDPCSSPIIAATTDPRTRQNRIANCAALGIPTTYVDPNPTFSNQGKSGSNPNLQPEESTSHTISVILTPRWTPNFSAVFDYYDVQIEAAIATLSAQTLVNLCVDEDALNPSACGQITRAAATEPNAFEIIDFLEGPFNFAALRARGMDFTMKYHFEPGDLFGGREWGRVDLGVTGNYLIRRQSFTNPTNPGLATDVDTTLNNPRVRFRTTATWTKGPLALTWRTDVQTSQELFNLRLVGQNVDSRPREFFETGAFVQNDISFRYDVNEKATVRGGVVNVFDAEPNVQTGFADNFDLFGRRYFVGVTARF